MAVSLRKMVENYFVRHLDSSDEDEHKKVEIPILYDNTPEAQGSVLIPRRDEKKHVVPRHAVHNRMLQIP